MITVDTENQIDIEEIESVEEHSPEQEAALLSELGDEADFDPEQAGLSVADNKQALAQGAASAMAVLGISEQIFKQMGHKDFAFDPSQAENVANAAAPLLVKYGGEMPPWLAAYKEEIAFVMAAGALGFSSYQQIRHLKAVDAAKEVEQETGSEPKEEAQ